MTHDPLHNHDGDEPHPRESRVERDLREAAEDRTVRVTGIERHVQSILLAVITASVLYLGSFVIGSREDAVRWGSQIAALTSEVSAMRSEIATMRSNYIGREDFRDHESRLRAIEANERNYRPERR